MRTIELGFVISSHIYSVTNLKMLFPINFKLIYLGSCSPNSHLSQLKTLLRLSQLSSWESIRHLPFPLHFHITSTASLGKCLNFLFLNISFPVFRFFCFCGLKKSQAVQWHVLMKTMAFKYRYILSSYWGGTFGRVKSPDEY